MAAHMFKDENERIHVYGLGGHDLTAVENNLVDMYGLTKLTKGKKNAIFHVAVSPRENEALTEEQKALALEMIAKRFGLQGQIYFSIDHIKEGRAHTHVFWSAVDMQNGKLINLSHYKRVLQDLAKEMELEFGHELTNRRANEKSFEMSHADRMIQGRTGEKALDRKLLVTALWNQTTTAEEFIKSLKAAGYDVVKGERCKFGIIDPHGKVHNLVRDLPKLVKAKDVTKRLGQIYDDLPTVRDIKKEREAALKRTIKISKAIQFGLDHFLERQSTVRFQQLSEYISPDEPYADADIMAGLKDRDDVIMAVKDEALFITTLEALHAEEDMIAFARAGKNTKKPINPDYIPKQEFLNEGQRKAIAHALTSKDQIIIISGGAGVGKTSLMKEVKQGIEEKGKTILAFAPSANASRGVLRDKGFEGADTIANLLRKQTLQEQAKNNIILIDEAGMVGNKTMNRIFAIAKKMNARVILSGDWRQHSSPEAGDALRILEEKAGLQIGRVTKVVRQKNEPYRQAVDALAHGKTKESFRRLRKMKVFKVVMDDEKRYQLVAQDYVQSVKAGRSTLLVSPTHAEGRAVSAVVRETLKSEKLIGKKDKTFTTQKDLSLTIAERTIAKSYKPGMSVQFHGEVKGFETGQSYDVKKVNEKDQVFVQHKSGLTKMLPLYEAAKFQAFGLRQTDLTTGDLLKITVNGHTLSGHPVNNGDVYTVSGFDKLGNIQLDNGEVLGRDYRNFTLGYYNTSHASQGRDAQDIFLVQGSRSFGASNDKQFYVSVSRGEETLNIYTDDLAGLQQKVGTSGNRMTAMEVAQNCPRFVFNQAVKTPAKEDQESIDLKETFQEHTGSSIQKDPHESASYKYRKDFNVKAGNPIVPEHSKPVETDFNDKAVPHHHWTIFKRHIGKKKKEFAPVPQNNRSIRNKLDTEQAWNTYFNKNMGDFKDMLEEHYKMDEVKEEIEALKKAVETSNTFLGRLLGTHERNTIELDRLNKTLKKLDQNLAMQLTWYRVELEKQMPDILKDKPKLKKTREHKEPSLDKRASLTKSTDLPSKLKQSFTKKPIMGRSKGQGGRGHEGGRTPDL